jgi:hypothetical protein
MSIPLIKKFQLTQHYLEIENALFTEMLQGKIIQSLEIHIQYTQSDLFLSAIAKCQSLVELVIICSENPSANQIIRVFSSIRASLLKQFKVTGKKRKLNSESSFTSLISSLNEMLEHIPTLRKFDIDLDMSCLDEYRKIADVLIKYYEEGGLEYFGDTNVKFAILQSKYYFSKKKVKTNPLLYFIISKLLITGKILNVAELKQDEHLI